MDTTARRRRKVVVDTSNDIYNHDVVMYNDYPNGDIALWEFEDLALERLQLLRIIEQASLKGHKPFTDDWKKCIKEDLSKGQLKRYLRMMGGYCSQSDQDYQARRADFLSHHILRLAYCRSEDLRRWFLNREIDWFKIRFISQTQQGVMKFLHNNNFTYTPISQDEKDNIRSDIMMSTVGMSDVAIDSSDFYKVPFTEVCPLVAKRRVFLKDGFAYIPSSELVVCIQAKFRASLNQALNVICHRIPNLDDDRINSLLSNIHNTYTGQNYTVQTDTEAINPAEIDNYSKKHFPMCMRTIHDVLRTAHHVKHFSRLQYGLFLKGIGLIYENAMEFWRQEFTKAMDQDKFDKSYLYNFKHQFGKVGNMTNYSPYSCMKIIMNNVGPGEHHGCPFKHWDPSILKTKLNDYGVNSEAINTINDLVCQGHYQIACTRYFEATHNQAPQNTISHPNQYFEESKNIGKENKAPKKN
ncbi:unnamed protein product [Brassicogethes aeneus]|uniref:DNA primase large subunit n=1 Tax=Brassicogethes aeneus TaxID=1431903 RepID=A0A9P0ATB4_BRAAE|nr:unnamed protein product [Brassicogethes aeneus]